MHSDSVSVVPDIELFAGDIIPNEQEFASKWQRKYERERQKHQMIDVISKYEWAKDFVEIARNDIFHPFKSRSVNEKLVPHIDALIETLTAKKQIMLAKETKRAGEVVKFASRQQLQALEEIEQELKIALYY